MISRSRHVLMWVALAVVLGGCEELPDDVKRRAEATPAAIDSAAAFVAAQEASFEALARTDTFAVYRPYAEREDWSRRFDEAREILAEAETVYDEELTPLIEADEPEQSAQARGALAAIRRLLRDAGARARWPFQRRETLARARTEPGEFVETAEAQVREIAALREDLAGPAQAMREKYPRREASIDSLEQSVARIADRAGRALEAARAELAAHEREGTADYAVLADSAAAVEASFRAANERAPETVAQLRQLDRSYTRILADMRVDYWVVVGRSAWDNCCDGSEYERTSVYPPVQVPPETFEYLATEATGTIARHGKSWGNWDTNVEIRQAAWEELGVEPHANWPDEDFDDAEYWIEDAYPRTWHRYLVVENADTSTTGWVEVDEDDFWELENALGMAIVSKPYGYFESEVIDAPTPPGLNYVGNPEYGCWRESPEGPCLGEQQARASGGTSFWHWYGPYLFFSHLFGPSYRYGYNDWNDWNRNYRGRRAYYGRNEGRPVWGTWGSRTGSGGRFASTTFARRGGFQRQDASVRGAGPSARGRGPGGLGK